MKDAEIRTGLVVDDAMRTSDPDILAVGECIEHQGAIVVHGNAQLGDDCIIRQGVTIGNRYMDRPNEAPTLGDRVNVGAGAKLLGKITVGDDAAIGANAVVLHNVEANTAVVGIPAKPIGNSKPQPQVVYT